MRYKVLDSFKAQTTKGEMELQAGQIITLPKEKALRLLSEGKITPLEKVAYKIYSEPLQAYLWVVADIEEMKALRDEGVTEAVYTHKDITELKKLPSSKEALKAIHKIKEAFPESSIDGIKNETTN